MKKYVVVLLGLMLVLIMGCSKINQDNYNELKIGMLYDQVSALLGKPDECTAVLGAKHCVWGNKDKHIKVQFVGDQIIFFSSKGI